MLEESVLDTLRQQKRNLWSFLGWSPKGRASTIYAEDIMITSYPRSGNTWMRFLLANMQHPNKSISFVNIETLVPDIYQNRDKTMRKLPGPRLLKSHEYFDPRYERVLYLVRDPRDVVISCYFYHMKTRRVPSSYPLNRYVEDFVAGTLDSFGSWGENVGSWLGTRQHDPNFCLVLYEDLKQSTLTTLEKVAAFLKWNITPEVIQIAINNSDISQMRTMEKQQEGHIRHLRHGRDDIDFVRKGISGQWKTQLTDADKQHIEHAWSHLMRQLGYL